MLLIVLFLCVVISLLVAFRRKDELSVYLLGMSVSNSLMLFGIIIYIAQMGGLAARERTFLFLLPDVQRFLQFLPISMSRLGYLVALGRTMFPYFVLMVGLEVTMIPFLRRKHREIKYLALVLPLLTLAAYYPPVFKFLVRKNFWILTTLGPATLAWILGYLLISFWMIVKEYRAITIPFYRRSNGYMFFSVGSISALYILYATKDPAQIYNMFIGEYIRLGITSYIGPSLSVLGWVVLGACTIFFVVLGSYSTLCYTQIDNNENKEDIILQRKFDAAGVGISVFVHGIKNQLLSSRVLHKKLTRELSQESPNLDEIRSYAQQLRELNEGMIGRMEELYRTVKNSALSLRPVPVEAIMNSAVKRFHGKYPEGTIELEVNTERLVLADPGPLSEAIYNLLTNGYEAAIQAGREPYVKLTSQPERMWTVLEIRDNGGGIPLSLQSKIYEPFFTSKNTNYNWGMGLYYVRKIVKSHWGRIRLESEEGEGSTFFVMLPLFDPDHKEKRI